MISLQKLLTVVANHGLIFLLTYMKAGASMSIIIINLKFSFKIEYLPCAGSCKKCYGETISGDNSIFYKFLKIVWFVMIMLLLKNFLN